MMLVIPYPPSMNRYWRSVNGRVLISKEGRNYRADVLRLLGASKTVMSSRLQVHICAYMPDNRRRDLDNLNKAVLDSLTHAGVWFDDSLIDDLRITRQGVEAPGRLEIFINEINK
jgi:crossover junction endodeoxyribonuclease RusA